MPKHLTDHQIATYEADGFVAPVDVMSPAEAAGLRERLEAVERRFPERLHARARNNAHFEFRFLDEIVHHPRILDAAEDIVGPDILLWSTVLFIKEPDSAAHVSFHQDATYMGLEPQNGVTAWLALTDATVENGCMLMEAGSHKGEIRDHRDTFDEDNILTRGQTIEAVNGNRVSPVELKAGQMSLHHVRTVHASAPNRSDERRIGVALQAFLAPTTRQVLGQSYAALVRGNDTVGNFLPGRRPVRDHEPEGAALRDAANDHFARILYAGAQQRRTL